MVTFAAAWETLTIVLVLVWAIILLADVVYFTMRTKDDSRKLTKEDNIKRVVGWTAIALLAFLGIFALASGSFLFGGGVMLSVLLMYAIGYIVNELKSRGKAAEAKPIVRETIRPLLKPVREEDPKPKLPPCKACGQPLSKNAKVCPHCGEPGLEPESSNVTGFGAFIAVLAALALGAAVLFPERLPTGWGLQETPVVLKSRPALVGKGQVVTLTNESAKTLHSVRVVCQNEVLNQEKVFAREILKPGGSITIGWAEGWDFLPGEKVTVSAAGHLKRTWTIRGPAE